jgi:hypothetical protein
MHYLLNHNGSGGVDISGNMFLPPRNIFMEYSVSDEKPRCSLKEDIVIGVLIKRSKHFLIVTWISLFIFSTL